MDPIEQKRRNTLIQIVGEKAFNEYSFYDEVPYDNLIIEVRIVESPNTLKALKELRGLLDIPVGHLSKALKGAASQLLYKERISDAGGCLERSRAIKKAQKVKAIVESNGGNSEIDLSLEEFEFKRSDCGESELEYLKVRITTLM